MRFRKPAADEQTIRIGQTVVEQGIEGDQFGPRRLKGPQIIRIIEAESRIAGDGDADVGGDGWNRGADGRRHW